MALSHTRRSEFLRAVKPASTPGPQKPHRLWRALWDLGLTAKDLGFRVLGLGVSGKALGLWLRAYVCLCVAMSTEPLRPTVNGAVSIRVQLACAHTRCGWSSSSMRKFFLRESE